MGVLELFEFQHLHAGLEQEYLLGISEPGAIEFQLHLSASLHAVRCGAR